VCWRVCWLSSLACVLGYVSKTLHATARAFVHEAVDAMLRAI
jgi:hypothetical protein